MVRKRLQREPLGEAGLFEYAVGALARRMRTERELRRLMQQRAIPGGAGEQAMDAVVHRLKELHYLSDVRFAATYTRVRKEDQKLGRRRVEQDLAARGVPRGIATKQVNEAYADVDEMKLARDYVERKRMARPEGQKEQARTMGRLLRAGFSSATVWKLLREWGVEAEEFEAE
ncbi:MAG TPA: RecX family transcriptional regulator [Acidobacteriaceae bacterium]|nr:RecX family transcriptional regulator [Acidobacteriaceae bacterium]